MAAGNKLPVYGTLGCILTGLVIAALAGFGGGSLLGGVVAGLGILPAMWGMWTGMQEKTQTTLATSVVLFFASLAVAGLLILLRFVDWLR